MVTMTSTRGKRCFPWWRGYFASEFPGKNDAEYDQTLPVDKIDIKLWRNFVLAQMKTIFEPDPEQGLGTFLTTLNAWPRIDLPCAVM